MITKFVNKHLLLYAKVAMCDRHCFCSKQPSVSIKKNCHKNVVTITVWQKVSLLVSERYNILKIFYSELL